MTQPRTEAPASEPLPAVATFSIDLRLTRQTRGPHEDCLSCLFCHRGHKVEWETSFRPQGTGTLITSGVCETCRTQLKSKRPALLGDDSDEQAALYYRALEDLTMDIEVHEGAEDGVPVASACRNAATLIRESVPTSALRDDTLRALQAIAFRFDEVLDREDLKL